MKYFYSVLFILIFPLSLLAQVTPDPIPYPLSPTMGAINVDVNPTFTWIDNNNFGSGLTYRIQVLTDTMVFDTTFSSPPNGFISNPDGSKSFYLWKTLELNKLYYWRVGAKIGTNAYLYNSNNNGWRNFTTTILIAPTTPVLSLPIDNDTLVILRPNFVWNSSIGGIGQITYSIQIANNSSFNSPTQYSTNATNISPITLQSLTRYYWRVKAANTGGTSLWSTIRTFKTIQPISSPRLKDPSNNSVNMGINSLVFKWYKVSESSSYTFMISISDTNMGTMDTTSYILTSSSDTALVLSGFGYDHKYWWRVRSERSSDSSWSSWYLFTTANNLSSRTVTLRSPILGAWDIPKTATLRWDTVKGVTSYIVRIGDSTTVDFTSGINNVDSFNVTNNNSLVVYLSDTCRWYFWKVRGLNSLTSTQFSQRWNFKTYDSIPVTVRLPDTILVPSLQIPMRIPIISSNLKNKRVTSFETTIQFDTSILHVDSVGRWNGAILADSVQFGSSAIFQYNVDSINISSSLGRIKILYSHDSAIGSRGTGNGVLFWIYGRIKEFYWNGSWISNQGRVSPLNFASFIFNNGTPIADVINGRITVDYKICGDVDLNNAINSADAALILRSILSDTVLNNRSQRNADIDDNGQISAFDASLVLRNVVGLPNLANISTCWRTSLASKTKKPEIKTFSPIFYLITESDLNGNIVQVLKMKGFNLNDEVYSVEFDLVDSRNQNLLRNIFNRNLGSNYLTGSKILSNKMKFVFINPYGINPEDIEIVIPSTDQSLIEQLTLYDIRLNNNYYSSSKLTGINKSEKKITEYNLIGAYPNPFNPVTNIVIALPYKSIVKLEIFDIKGSKIIELKNDEMEYGIHEVAWNGKDQYGKAVASGQYFCRMNAGSFSKTILLRLIK